MARRPRAVVPELPQHVVQRGNDKRDIFFTTEDRRSYLRRMIQFANEFAIRFIAYVLMTNHVHFVVIVPSAAALSRFMQRLQSEHARRVNELRGTTGHVFGERFYSNSIDLDVAPNVVRYVELNPVRAGMVSRATDFEFSSARAHAFRTYDPVLGRIWEPLDHIDDYAGFLDEPVALGTDEAIRKLTRRGRRVTAERLVATARPRVVRTARTPYGLVLRGTDPK